MHTHACGQVADEENHEEMGEMAPLEGSRTPAGTEDVFGPTVRMAAAAWVGAAPLSGPGGRCTRGSCALAERSCGSAARGDALAAAAEPCLVQPLAPNTSHATMQT